MKIGNDEEDGHHDGLYTWSLERTAFAEFGPGLDELYVYVEVKEQKN